VDLTKDLMQELAKKERELGDVKEKKENEKVDLTKDLMRELADVKEKKEYEKSELSNSITNLKNDIKYRTELLLRLKRMCNVRGALEFIRSMVTFRVFFFFCVFFNYFYHILFTYFFSQ